MEKSDIEQLLVTGKRVSVKVKTQMPVTRIVFEKSRVENRELALVMDIHAAAEQNKANIEIIKFFKKIFKINVRIIRGLTSREKVIEII